MRMAGTVWVQGQPRWVDLSSSDLDRSIDFYRELFDWEATRGGERYGGYVTFSKNDFAVAGLAGKMPGAEGTPDAWTTYLHTADAAATAQSVIDAGGRNLFTPMDIPDMGVMGVAVDPTGGTIGSWQGSGHDGFEAHGEVGSPVWHELYADDFDAALSFYRRAFGWSTRPLSDTDDFRYELLVDGDHELAGIFDAGSRTDATPSRWQVYFGVKDTDRTVGHALELGGRVTEAPYDSPYGRMAALVDATGAAFIVSTVV